MMVAERKTKLGIAHNRDCYFRDLGHLEVCNRKTKKTGFSELFEEGTRWKELAGVLLFYKGVSHELTISPGQTWRLALLQRNLCPGFWFIWCPCRSVCVMCGRQRKAGPFRAPLWEHGRQCSCHPAKLAPRPPDFQIPCHVSL